MASGVLRRKPGATMGEARLPIPAKPGRLERYDYEYRRNGTVNLFVLLDVHRPWRKVKVTERAAARDYAHCMRDLVDIDYPDAEIIRAVQENLSTHSAGAPWQPFPRAEARRICGGSSSTTPPSTQVGSTWSTSKSAFCEASAWIAGSTTPSDCAAKSPPGNGNEMPPAHPSNGYSQETRLAPKWVAPIPPLSKSHNHCAEPVAGVSVRFRSLAAIAPSRTDIGRSKTTSPTAKSII